MTLMVMLDTEITEIPMRVCHPWSHQNGSCYFMFFYVAYDFFYFMFIFKHYYKRKTKSFKVNRYC